MTTCHSDQMSQRSPGSKIIYRAAGAGCMNKYQDKGQDKDKDKDNDKDKYQCSRSRIDEPSCHCPPSHSYSVMYCCCRRIIVFIRSQKKHVHFVHFNVGSRPAYPFYYILLIYNMYPLYTIYILHTVDTI